MPTYIEYLLFDRDEWNKLMAEQLQPHVEQFLANGGTLAASRAEALGIIGAFDVSNPQVQEFLSRYTFNRIKDINEVTIARLRQTLSEGMNAGEGIRELKDRILNDAFLGKGATPYRAEVIARTESARAQIEGGRLAYQESNRQAQDAGTAEPFSEMEFVASPDCCKICAAKNGTRVPMSGVLDLPHPSCRCDYEPIVNPLYER